MVTGTGNYIAIIPIIYLNDKDNYSIEADFLPQNKIYNYCGFYLANRNNDTSIGSGFFLRKYTNQFYKVEYTKDRDIIIFGSEISSASGYYHLKMKVNCSNLTGEIYNSEGTLLNTLSLTNDIDNKQMGILIDCETGASDSKFWIKNIKVKNG